MAGIEKLVTNGLQVAQSAIQKSSGVLSAATKPIEAGSEKLTGALNGLAASNSALVKKSSIPELVDETIELLNGCTRKPLNPDLSNLSPKNMVLVHATDYFPEGGIIRTTANATLAETGHINPRFKVHSAINHMVQSHHYGNWNEKQYAILMPMDGVLESNPKSSILGGELIDFFIQGDVKLPKGSVVIKTGCADIPSGKMRISDLPNQEGIRLIETSRCDTPEITNEMIKQMGYIQHSPKNEPDLLHGKIFRKKSEYEAWDNFTSRYGLVNGMHSYTPWGRSEMLLDNIEILQEINNNWMLGGINHQEKIVQAIEDIKKSLPDGKKLDYDIDELARIVRESKTPKEASENIFKNLNLKHSKLSKEQYPIIEYIRSMEILSNSKSLDEAESQIKQTCPSVKLDWSSLREELKEEYNGIFQDMQSDSDFKPDNIIRGCTALLEPYKNITEVSQVLEFI